MDRRTFLAVGSLAAAAHTQAASGLGAWAEPETAKHAFPTDSSIEVAAYYFGNYHVDARNVKAHGPGWTEWSLVKAAKPRFPGHQQPRVPLWGYQDESDPGVFAAKVDAAADHGLTAFLFDWYWYNDGSFLAAALEEGFLKAKNRQRMKFGIMWANHDWVDIHPAKLTAPANLQFPGAVTPATFSTMTNYLIENYFRLPNYLLVEGCPYFSIYDPGKLIAGFGSLQAAAIAMEDFRSRVKKAGFPDLHFNVVLWNEKVLEAESVFADAREFLQRLRVDSVGSYVWIHHTHFRTFPEVSYTDLASQYEEYREQALKDFSGRYISNVTVGWDSTPRTCQTDGFVRGPYPYMPVVHGNTPAEFERYLASARRFAVRPDVRFKMVTINSWNEWTEGSYLEPDIETGTGYLQAVQRVFGARRNAQAEAQSPS